MRPLIYLVTNRVNGKRYVGVTRYSVAKRWSEHLYSARTQRTNARLHKAIRKYGQEAFEVSALATCLSPEDAQALERMLIEQLRPEYNATNGGEFTAQRVVRTADVGRRISEGLRGKPKSAEARKAMSIARVRMLATNPQELQRSKDSIAKARASMDREKQRAAVTIASANRVWSAESRAKLSASCMGRRLAPDVIERMARSKCKPVECVDLACTFDSILEAASSTGVYFSNISAACRGKRPTAGGMTFRFA